MESIVDNSIWLSTIYINKYNYSKTYQMLGHCCVVAAIFLLSLVVFPRILDVAWADSMPENWSHPQKCSDCAYSLCFSCSSFICFSQTWITIWQSNMAIWTIWTIINGVLMETSWFSSHFQFVLQLRVCHHRQTWVFYPNSLGQLAIFDAWYCLI